MVVYFLMSGWFFSSSRDMRAMSWAEVLCWSAFSPSSSPVQLTKVVSAIPSSFALAFIIPTKASSDPAMCSAMAQAQSLAEETAMHLSISETDMVSPTFKYT